MNSIISAQLQSEVTDKSILAQVFRSQFHLRPYVGVIRAAYARQHRTPVLRLTSPLERFLLEPKRGAFRVDSRTNPVWPGVLVIHLSETTVNENKQKRRCSTAAGEISPLTATHPARSWLRAIIRGEPVSRVSHLAGIPSQKLFTPVNSVS
ncbi:hypothetical protein WA026_014558 [Henosepilachna vigintioctopunctata]|uniref:Uncharacterized protein n=1 Tax=Henosepilachna vigintioctopunctata TaxID=420089 RepID=A0AAW1VFF9_9CUCU